MACKMEELRVCGTNHPIQENLYLLGASIQCMETVFIRKISIFDLWVTPFHFYAGLDYWHSNPPSVISQNCEIVVYPHCTVQQDTFVAPPSRAADRYTR